MRVRRFGLRRPGPTAPEGPAEGDMYWNTASKELFVFDGTNWREVTIT